MAARNPFLSPNVYVVAAIARAAQARTIVVDFDVRDDQGVKLLSRGDRVQADLAERLGRRRLALPLENCLIPEGGLTNTELLNATTVELDTGHPVTSVVQPFREQLLLEVVRLPLHPAAQLALVVAQDNGGGQFAHALRAMCLAGSFAAHSSAGGVTLRDAMVAGLMHDVGEPYVLRETSADGRRVDAQAFRRSTVHPRVGQAWVEHLTPYPAAVALAIGEHHERLDGTGYSGRRGADETSELGRLLAVVEAVLGPLSASARLPLTRSMVALQLFPGEFEQRWSGLVQSARNRLEPQGSEVASAEDHAALVKLVALLQKGFAAADALTTDNTSLALKATARMVIHRLTRLKKVWGETGLWAFSGADGSNPLTTDALLIAKELRFRVRALQREVDSRRLEMLPEDAQTLRQLLSALET